jgi:geranylgeranyl pyrophosphate synthase
MLHDSQAVSSALRQAEHYASLAQQHLSFFPPSLERDALMSLPEYVIARDR